MAGILNCSLWSPPWNNENKSCLNELKFWEASENHKSSICWKFQLSISCGTQKSDKMPQTMAKMIWSFFIQILEELKTIENGFWDFPTFTIDSDQTDNPRCGNANQKKVDLENDVILKQISNKRDVSAKWISGKNSLKILFCFKNCCDSCLDLLWLQNDFGLSKSF